MIPFDPRNRVGRAVSLAALSLLLLSAGMCRQATNSEQAEAEETAAAEEALAAEQAAAEAAERERLAAIAAAEQELAEREARLAEEEERQRQQALEAERQRLAATKAAAEARQRELAARERELAEREAELAQRAQELAEAEEALAAEELAAEPSGSGYRGGYDEPWRSGGGERVADGGTTAQPAPAPAPKPKASLPPGEILEVQMQRTLSSGTSRVGEVFNARLTHDVFDSKGTLVIPAGSTVRGKVIEARPYRRGEGPATIGVQFTHVVVPPDQTVGIKADFVELGTDRKKNRKKVIGGAVAGAILGHILGGDGSKNVLIGAAVGAAAGGAAVASARDRDAEIPAGQVLSLELREVVTVEVAYGQPVGR